MPLHLQGHAADVVRIAPRERPRRGRHSGGWPLGQVAEAPVAAHDGGGRIGQAGEIAYGSGALCLGLTLPVAPDNLATPNPQSEEEKVF